MASENEATEIWACTIAATQLKATAKTIKVFIVNDDISVALQSPLKIVRAGGFVWSGSAQEPGGGAAWGASPQNTVTLPGISVTPIRRMPGAAKGLAVTRRLLPQTAPESEAPPLIPTASKLQLSSPRRLRAAVHSDRRLRARGGVVTVVLSLL